MFRTRTYVPVVYLQNTLTVRRPLTPDRRAATVNNKQWTNLRVYFGPPTAFLICLIALNVSEETRSEGGRSP